MPHRFFRRILLLLVILSSFSILAACSSTGTPSTASPSVVSEPAYAPDITEDILLSINNADYEKHIQNFDSAMKEATSREAFDRLVNTLNTRVGTYVPDSKKFYQAVEQGKYTVVIYVAEYTNEPEGVAVSVSFYQENGQTLVGGLYFNSPKLHG